MTSDLFTQLLQEVAILGGLLIVGVFLRAKIKFFQNLFLPASVIGGFLGLVLGPVILEDYALLPISETMLKDFALLPGILIVPIIGSVPLGLGMGVEQNSSESRTEIIPMFLLAIAGTFALFAVGFGTNLIFSRLLPELNIYKAFGMELALGFSGGHGTAGLVGNIFHKLGFPYWEVAQGVTVTAATVGIIGGIVFGMIMINAAARKNRITNLADPSAIPEEARKGYQHDISSQEMTCRETTHSSSVDNLTLIAAIIFGVCGLAYGAVYFLKTYKVPLLSTISPWAYAIFFMLIVNQLMRKLNLSFLIDLKLKGKFTSFLVDFAIVAAIASLPVQAVLQYAVPMVFMFVAGFLTLYLMIFLVGQHAFKDYKFERAIALFGQNTGVAMTGILLLRICDPEMKTPVLKDFSIGYALCSMLVFTLLMPLIKLISNTWLTLSLVTGVMLISLAGLFIYSKLPDKKGTG